MGGNGLLHCRVTTFETLVIPFTKGQAEVPGVRSPGQGPENAEWGS